MIEASKDITLNEMVFASGRGPIRGVSGILCGGPISSFEEPLAEDEASCVFASSHSRGARIARPR